MLEVSSLESFPVLAGHPRGGTIYIVASPCEMNRDKPEIMGESIRLDGKVVTVRAVERRLPNSSIRVGELIGLLV